MSDKISRALRRHHRQRMHRYARNIVKGWSIQQNQIELVASLHRDNMKKCSCQMCTNDRRCQWNKNNAKLTMQERKAFESYVDQLEECDGHQIWSDRCGE